MLYKNKEELIKAINKYFKEEKAPTPRHMRVIGLGVSKSVLSNWKTKKPEYFDLIKDAEDFILAHMERTFAYGGKDMYNIALTLRAYDKEQYAPELTRDQVEHQDVQIIAPKALTKKGVQSDRKLPKLLKA